MEQRQITIVVAVIINDNNEVLLAKRNEPGIPEAHNKWEFPGGGIEFGETPEQAIIREVKEEVGVTVEIVSLLPKILSEKQNLPGPVNQQVIIISFLCKITSGEPSADFDKEIAEVKFIPVNEINNYDTFANIPPTVSMLNS